jgi:hypothetical protein
VIPRSTTIDPRTAELEPWPLDPEQIVGEAPEVSGLVLEVGPGDVGLLHPGDRTTWRVHETLLEVFQVTNP